MAFSSHTPEDEEAYPASRPGSTLANRKRKWSRNTRTRKDTAVDRALSRSHPDRGAG